MNSDAFPPSDSGQSITSGADQPEGTSKQEAAHAEVRDLERRIADLRRQEERLRKEVADLQATYDRTLKEQMVQAQMMMGQVVQEGLADLEQRKQALQIAVEQLERRQERIRTEMRTTFAGTSQDLAIRIQGFKDYLVGSLQDLAAAAEQLQLVREAPEPEMKPVRDAEPTELAKPNFGEQSFEEQTRLIRRLLDQFRDRPDYYGPPWQLRRTFEPIHAERVSKWFFDQGGKGALKSMGSRLQNILVASAAIAILRRMYGDRLWPLVLANSPERLGEWRRGLQDCLGITRADFGPDQGIVLFEAAEPLALKADRLEQEGDLPLIIIDDTENQVSLSLLQFPLWLAFAPDPSYPAPFI